MAEANTTSEAETDPETVPETASAPPQTGGGRKLVGALLSILIIIGAIALTFYVWNVIEDHPRTDDATARANVIGIVPRVGGPIVKLHVVDNQKVEAGAVLFEIDPDDYEQALRVAKANLAALDEQMELARVQDQELAYTVKEAESGLKEAQSRLKKAQATLDRLEPLLTNKFVTEEHVDEARTARDVAAAAVEAGTQRLNKAKVAIGTLSTLTAQRQGLVAMVTRAELDLSYCKVTAPFEGRVISLNISEGAHVSPMSPVFSLLDTRQWYVMANFREGEIQKISPGQDVEVYLLSAPDQCFRGKVQGVGWAVDPAGEFDFGGMPHIKRELNWVHIAQRFPVRIAIEDPDPDLFRMGVSAVAIIKKSSSE